MVVWVAEPQMHLQWLAYIAEQCSDKKGGALISVVHGYLQHGSICAQKVSIRSAKVHSIISVYFSRYRKKCYPQFADRYT